MIQTKITKDIYHGDGTTRRFEVTFDYNTKDNVKQIYLYTCTYTIEEGVTKYNNDVTKITSNYDFEVVNDVTYAVYPSDAAVSDGATPMATGTAIIIMRNTPNEQLSTGQYTSEKVEKQLDRITMVAQELQEQLNRAYQAPEYVDKVNKADFATVANDIDAVNTVAAITEDIDLVNANAENITTVAQNIEDVNATGQNIEDVNTVALNINDVSTVAGIASDVTQVAGISTAVSNVSDNSSDVTLVSDNMASVMTTASSITDVQTVAGIATDVSAVADNNTNVTAVAGNATNINTVANKINKVETVADNISSVNTVSTNISDVTNVSDNMTTISEVSENMDDVIAAADAVEEVLPHITEINNISENIDDIVTVAGINADVSTVATNSSDISSVADNVTNINTVASNVSNIATAVNNMAAIIAAPTAATNAANSALNAATSATNAQKWAEGTDSEVQPLGGTKSSKGWANRAQELVESIGTVMRYKGSVANYAALQAIQNPTLGDTYNVLDTGANYSWDGTNWDEIGSAVDLSAYRTAAQQDVIDAGKQETLVSGTNIKTVNGNSLLGSGNVDINGLPSQTGQNGKFLTTDGMDASWANIGGTLPSQTGQSGKFLTTDGTDASWSDKPLVNTANQNTSLSIVGTTGTNTGYSLSVGVGAEASYGSFCTAVGASAKASVVGGSNGLAVGYNASVTKAYATQLGNGTNRDANTFKVANENGNYELMSADGTIPVARLNTMTGADGTNAGAQGAVPAPAATDNTKFLKGDGTWANPTASAAWGGITGDLEYQTDLQNELDSKAPAVLLSHFWSDHIINEMSYLRGDTFSWQSGDVYTAAYEHITDDIITTIYDQDDYTVVGSPIINSGVISNFSSSNYVEYPSFTDDGKDVRMTIGFMLPTGYPNYAKPLTSFGNSGNNCSMFVVPAYKGGIEFRIKSGLSLSVQYTLEEETLYVAELKRKNGKYTLKLYNPVVGLLGSAELTDATLIGNGDTSVIKYGHDGKVFGAEFPGSIYMNYTTVGHPTAQTETIGNYTITYYEADDTHKICLADQENTIFNLFNKYGAAGYYILDTANMRFKLPRDSSGHGQLIDKKNDGTNYYLVFEDGYCIQGGRILSTANTRTTITFHKEFLNTNYDPKFTCLTYINDGYIMGFDNLTTTTMDVWNTMSQNPTIEWSAQGYVQAPANPYKEFKKYLYFYVGTFTKTAYQETAGLNSELFNGKADRNLSNVTGTSGFRKLISANKTGNAWYKVYAEYDPSTGTFLGNWCEQGDTVTRTAAAAQTITYPLPFADTSYTLIQNYQGGTANGNTGENENGYFDKTTTGFTKKSTVALTYITEFAYVAYGYI